MESISIFGASGGENLENFSGCVFDEFTSLPNVIHIYIWVILTMGNRLLKCLIRCMGNAIVSYQFVFIPPKR